MKIQCPEKIIVGYLNINSVRNKFDAFFFITDTNIDILLISETKLPDSFPSAQFRLKGFYTPYRLDRNPSRFLNSGSTFNIETISVEINLRRRKRLLPCCYNPQKSLISSYLNITLNKYSKSYENLVFMGHFIVTMDDKFMINFLGTE